MVDAAKFNSKELENPDAIFWELVVDNVDPKLLTKKLTGSEALHVK